MRIAPLFALCACLTPGWPDDTVAPNGRVPWSHPSDDACLELADPKAVEIDGFLLCGIEGGLRKIAVDDPVHERCDTVGSAPLGVLVSLFDGSRARGYPVAMMRGREVVNTDWDGEPILVDY